MIDQKLMEAVVLEHITTPEIFRELSEKGITSKSFVVYGHIYSFIEGYIKGQGKVPELHLTRAINPDFSPSNTEYTNFFLESLLDAQLRRDIQDVLRDGIDKFSISAKGGLTYIIENLNHLHRDMSHSIPRSFTDRDALMRLERVENPAMIRKFYAGIPSLKKYLDYSPGIMLGLVGRTSQGKSSLALFMGCCTYVDDGSRILFISPEMTRLEVNLRWDTIMMRKCFKTILPNTDLREGKVKVEEYKKWLEQASLKSDWITYDAYSAGKPFTVSNIGMLIDEHNPDVVIVDGLMLLRDDHKGSQSWEKVHNLSYGLKELVETKNVGMIVTNQLNREGAKADIPGLETISFGDSFAQACDKVLMITPYPGSSTMKNVRLEKNRVGPVMTSAQPINLDVESGIIGEE